DVTELKSSCGRRAVRDGRSAWLDAAQHRFRAREQLEDTDWFDDVVVCSASESLNLVDLAIARGQDQYGCRTTVGAEAAQDVESVDLRQHQIEDHEIGCVFGEPLERNLAVRRPVHVVSFELEARAKAECES